MPDVGGGGNLENTEREAGRVLGAGSGSFFPSAMFFHLSRMLFEEEAEAPDDTAGVDAAGDDAGATGVVAEVAMDDGADDAEAVAGTAFAAR